MLQNDIMSAYRHIGTNWAPTAEILQLIQRQGRVLGLKDLPVFDKHLWMREVEKDLGPFGSVEKILRRKTS